MNVLLYFSVKNFLLTFLSSSTIIPLERYLKVNGKMIQNGFTGLLGFIFESVLRTFKNSSLVPFLFLSFLFSSVDFYDLMINQEPE